MASSSFGEDFSLLAEDNYHQTNPDHHLQHHHPMLHHSYTSPPRSTLPPAAADTSPNLPDSDEEDEEDREENETDSPFIDANNPYSDADASNVRTKRRIDHHNNPQKRGRSSSAAEYRKDREEWSDVAIGCLLDAYLEKFTHLSRGNLRGRDWEGVAGMVSERCEKQRKSVEQCKNKVDNLKKRYKLERNRITSGSISASHWPWFQKMEEIVGNSLPVKVVVDEDKGSFGGGGSCTIAVRQAKRYFVFESNRVVFVIISLVLFWHFDNG